MNKKKFILIGHKKQHGKDTFAKMLKEHLGDAEILSFADPMREIVAQSLGMSIAELKEKYTRDSNLRDVMKRFGNGMMIEYFGEKVWRDVLLRRAAKLDCEYIIVPDFRFHRELIEGAITVHVYNERVRSHDTHQSEVDLNDFNFDYVINNNGSLEDLNQYAENFCSLYFDTNKVDESGKQETMLTSVTARIVTCE